MGWTVEGAWLIVMQRQDIYTQLRGAHTHTHTCIEIFFTNLRTKLIYHRKGRKTKKKLCFVSFPSPSPPALLFLLFCLLGFQAEWRTIF